MKIGASNEMYKNLANAYKSGDDKAIAKGMGNFCTEMQNSLKKDYENVLNDFDNKILVQRGYRVLTQQEKSWYQKWIESAKKNNPKQAFSELITVEAMPERLLKMFIEIFKMNTLY